MPHLLKLHNENKDKGLVIIGVHSKNGGDKMAAFVEEQKIPYPCAIDSEGLTKEGFRNNSYPDYYVIDKKGILRYADLANSQVDAAIEALLAE